jgi:hypothetical protein
MLKPDDFQIPLEKQLKMRLVYDDIERCNDIKVLKESLRQVSDQLMKYQHLLGKVLEEQLLSELEKWDIEATKIVKEASNDPDA